MQRRKFLQNLSASMLLLMANGNIRSVQASPLDGTSLTGHPTQDNRFRFAITSDGHYGQPNTPFAENFDLITASINSFHATSPLQFCVVNGDIIHDNPAFLEPAAAALKAIKPPFYVTKGNHDMVSEARWKEVWKMPVNHSVEMGDNVLLLGTTADEKGKYLAPDTDWFRQQLKQYKSVKNIFIFIHITPVKWTKHAVDGKDFQQLLKESSNVRAVFNGHDHDQDGVKMMGNIPFLFDGHFGGNWGTAYKGFRVVELMEDNSLLTYIMNPLEKMSELNIYNSL